MRNVVFLHKWVLYFAVASLAGCVDFSLAKNEIEILLYSRIPCGMRGF